MTNEELQAVIRLTQAIDRYTDQLRRIADSAMAATKELGLLHEVAKEIMKRG